MKHVRRLCWAVIDDLDGQLKEMIDLRVYWAFLFGIFIQISMQNENIGRLHS